MVLRYLITLVFCLVLIWPVSPWAADAATIETIAADIAAQIPTFPGLSELAPRSTTLADFVAKSEGRLQQLADLSKQKETLSGISEHFKKITEEIKPLGSPDDWYVDRLTHYINQFSQLRQNLDDLQQKMTLRTY